LTEIHSFKNIKINIKMYSHRTLCPVAIHFFVNFEILKWLYLAYYWVYLHVHQTWGFCKAWSAPIVPNPRLIPSLLEYEIWQCCYVISLQFQPGIRLAPVNQNPQFNASVLSAGNATGGMALQADKFYSV